MLYNLCLIDPPVPPLREIRRNITLNEALGSTITLGNFRRILEPCSGFINDKDGQRNVNLNTDKITLCGHWTSNVLVLRHTKNLLLITILEYNRYNRAHPSSQISKITESYETFFLIPGWSSEQGSRWIAKGVGSLAT